MILGTIPYIDAFKNGFNKVFPINTLKCFTSTELEEVICGCSIESWDYETLLVNIVPNHGYDRNNIIYQGLLKIMVEMNNLEKKMFLLFVTGSPRLPLGGNII
jgi:E3 ubiquitin-protein ligase TRIP12